MPLFSALTLITWATAAPLTPRRVVLAPDPGLSYASDALHHPAVDWDSDRGQGVMVFATEQPPHANCPRGVTGLGYAVSPDGLNWTIAPEPLALPDPTALEGWSCRLTEPAVLYDASTDSLQVWFVAEGFTNRQTGIGHAEVLLDAYGSPILPATDIELAVLTDQYREPAVLRKNGTYHLMLASYPDLYVATGTGPRSWSAPELAIRSILGSADMASRGALSCDDAGAFPLRALAAEHTHASDDWTIRHAVASPTAPDNWVVDATPSATLPSSVPWSGFDVLTTDTYDTILYAGVNGRILLASTHAAGAGSPVIVPSRDCP